MVGTAVGTDASAKGPGFSAKPHLEEGMLAVGTDDGIRIFARDSGSWQPGPAGLDGVAVTQIAVERGRSAHLLAASRTGVHESDDGGASWRPALDGVDARSVVFDADGTAYVGTYPAGVWRRAPEGAFEALESLRELPTYGGWTFPVPPHLPNVRGIAVSPKRAGAVYAAVEVGGIMGSADRGDSWAELREGLQPDVHSVACVEGPDAVKGDRLYAATGVGFYRSHDAGASWEAACEGLEELYSVPLAVHPGEPGTVFTAAARSRPRTWRTRAEGADAKIYRSTDGADTWEAIMDGLPDTLVAAVDALAVDGDGTVYAGLADGRVLVGPSLAESWSVLAEGLPRVTALAVV